MAAITAEEYYNAHRAEEREYLPVFVARPVKKGDRLESRVFKITAEEDGYALSKRKGFMTAAALEEKTLPAESLNPAIPKRSLSAEELARITAIEKGDTFENDEDAITVLQDGFVVEKDSGGAVFMSALELAETFNNVARKTAESGERLVVFKDAAPVKGIFLTESVTFAFKEGPYTAQPGEFLYPNPDDRDGYSIEDFAAPNAAFRIAGPILTPEERQQAKAARHETLKKLAIRPKFQQ